MVEPEADESEGGPLRAPDGHGVPVRDRQEHLVVVLELVRDLVHEEPDVRGRLDDADVLLEDVLDLRDGA
eukprot:6742565-Alexandrium_andersonii.AAC.1